MFLAFAKSGRFLIEPLAMSIVEMRSPLEVQRFEIGLGSRAAVGDERDRLAVRRERRLHVGVLVVRQPAHFLRLRSKRKRSETPVAWPEMTMVWPSGDQATFVIASMPGTRIVLDVARVDVDDAEVVVALLEGDEGEALRVGDQLPAESMKRSASKCALRSVEPSLRMTLPGLRVGEEEIDVEDCARGEEGDVLAVRAVRPGRR